MNPQTKKRAGWGGAREGSGRKQKAVDVRRVNVTIKLHPGTVSELEWLAFEAHVSQAGYVEWLLLSNDAAAVAARQAAVARASSFCRRQPWQTESDANVAGLIAVERNAERLRKAADMAAKDATNSPSEVLRELREAVSPRRPGPAGK